MDRSIAYLIIIIYEQAQCIKKQRWNLKGDRYQHDLNSLLPGKKTFKIFEIKVLMSTTAMGRQSKTFINRMQTTISLCTKAAGILGLVRGRFRVGYI